MKLKLETQVHLVSNYGYDRRKRREFYMKKQYTTSQVNRRGPAVTLYDVNISGTEHTWSYNSKFYPHVRANRRLRVIKFLKWLERICDLYSCNYYFIRLCLKNYSKSFNFDCISALPNFPLYTTVSLLFLKSQGK